MFRSGSVAADAPEYFAPQCWFCISRISIGRARNMHVTRSTHIARSFRLSGQAKQFHGDGRDSELMLRGGEHDAVEAIGDAALARAL